MPTRNVVRDADLARQLLNTLQSPRVKIVLDAANLIEARPVGEHRAVIERAVDLLGADTVLALLARIHRRSLAAGLVLRLETPVDAVRPWLDQCEMVTLLGTAIGVKGHGLAPQAIGRLAKARALLRDVGP